jgi:cytochrome c553
MSFFIIKLILGTVFFLFGLGATLTMLILMGRTEKKASPETLKKLHKFFGYFFFLFLLALAVLGFDHWTSVGENIPTRALLHAVLALSLLIILITKILIARYYRQFLKMAPTLGLTVFCLAFVVFSISGVYYVLRGVDQPAFSKQIEQTGKTTTGAERPMQRSVEQGKNIFNRLCLSCHAIDSDAKKMGPSLMGLSATNTMPHTRKPVTFENIKQQLIDPALMMPAFKDLTDQEIADLTAFLKTL